MTSLPNCVLSSVEQPLGCRASNPGGILPWWGRLQPVNPSEARTRLFFSALISASPRLCVENSSSGAPMPPLKLPKGAIKPRPAVVAMAPYSPPTGGRSDKLRLDFNENTVGCSPQVIDSLQVQPLRRRPRRLSRIHRRQASHRGATSTSPPTSSSSPTAPTKPSRSSSTPTSMTARKSCVLKPAYAMYRFYAEVAGARIKEIAYPQPSMEFPLQELLDAITPETRAVLLSNPNNPTGTGLSLLAIERILRARAEGRRHGRRSLLRILRRHRPH